MKYQKMTFEEERAIYGEHNIEVVECLFDGEADGESALKECSDVFIDRCNFHLRYPLWHVSNASINNSVMTQSCRAALWYDQNIIINDCELGGIKALRECSNCEINNSKITSPEFGWKCKDVKLKNCSLEAEYAFLETKNLSLLHVEMKGKYSFQYVENLYIENSNLDTKDTFWHSKNVTVCNSIVKGEYLAWYSENLHLINCKIIGTQPLCYAKGLVIENCEMIDTDLAFEYSEVRADIVSSIISVKNPITGYIHAYGIGEIIQDEHQKPGSDCEISIIS